MSHSCTINTVFSFSADPNYVGNAAQNMNMMKKIALGMIANEKSIKKSKKRKMKHALIDEQYRELILKI